MSFSQPLLERFAFVMLLLFTGSAPLVRAEGPAAPKADYPTADPEEPLREQFSLPKAGESLDRVALAWTRRHRCGACHTTWPYLMARPALADKPTEAFTEIRRFFEDRVNLWDDEVKTNKHVTREAVGHAVALAMNDARSTGKLQPVTRTALDRMWTYQRKDGAWSWPKCSWPPFEIDDYYGAVFAAVGVGQAPEQYAQGEKARVGLDKLRGYLLKTPVPSLHHQAWLLWASTKLDGLQTAADKQTTMEELRKLQREDGGWSMESLGQDWVGKKGDRSKPDAPSDGYGTGLVVFVLREAGVPAQDEAIQRGVKWLKANQRESGRWFVRSLNRVEQHYISDTATAFAVLALKACE